MKSDKEVHKIYFVAPGGKPPSPEEEKLKENLKEIFSIIKDAWYSYEIWWILISKENRKKYFHALLHHKNFFEPSAFAHVTAMVIALYKLYDKKYLSLSHLISDAQQANLLSKEEYGKMQKKLKEALLIWKKITILRSNLFAHRHYELSRSSIYKKAKITPNQIKRLIVISVKIYNTLWVKVNKRPNKLDDLTMKTTLNMLEILDKDL